MGQTACVVPVLLTRTYAERRNDIRKHARLSTGMPGSHHVGMSQTLDRAIEAPTDAHPPSMESARPGGLTLPQLWAFVAVALPIVAALEGLAGRLAAPRLTAADLKELRALDAKMQSAAQAGDVTMFFNTNSAFHEIFIRRASNPRLEREIGKFRLLMRNFRIFLMKIPGRMKTSIDEHSAIIEAFAAKDVDRAEAAIRNHASSAEQALLQALDAVRMLS